MKDNSISKIQHSTLLYWYDGYIKRAERNRLNNHKSGLIWFTGLSASGKSTVAHLVEKKLWQQGIRTYVLDGDNVRHGLNIDLGFGREDRKENLRRIVEVCKLMVDAGLVVLTAFISPYKEDRSYVKSKLKDDYIEIYVKCAVEECERRDPKGLYKKARDGIIKNYTGISAPYEEPGAPDLVLETEKLDIGTTVEIVLDFLKGKDFLIDEFYR
jgi:adenylylsulfate kinase